jgi:hypothetical protein
MRRTNWYRSSMGTRMSLTEVGTNLLQSVKRFFAVGGFDNLVTAGSKDCRQELAVDWSILDDQNDGNALLGWRGARSRF